MPQSRTTEDAAGDMIQQDMKSLQLKKEHANPKISHSLPNFFLAVSMKVTSATWKDVK